MASITKLPSGAYRVQIRRKGRYASETFLRRDDAHRWARQAETRVDQGLAPNKSSVSRLQTFGDLIELHIVDMCEVGKPPRRSKAATLMTLKRDLGKEKIGHLDRQKLIDYGKMRAEQGDERYLSLDDLFASVKGRAERSRTRTVESAAIRVEAHRDNPEKLGLVLPGADEPIAPTHWSFGQISSLVGAPAAYLRQLPAPLAGINLQYGLTNHRAEQIKTMEVADGRTELRAVTGPDYGRIYDHELVSAVQRIAGNGTGDTRWKVPGVLDWSTGIYNPRVDVTKETTTLYASDRDVFLFLVDDLNPIEAGLLPDGSPDLYFRGFYCWNSEVGAKTLGIASFYLRAVCQNRNLWGVEDFQEITIRHSKYAASRFAYEAAPALSRFAESSPAPFIDGIRAAREKIVARSDEDRQDFLRKRGFSKAETGRIVETVLAEEGRPPESVFDFVQGITAVARSKPQQDARLVMEGKAKALLEKV